MGAAYALVLAYLAVIGGMHWLTRRRFQVAFDWPRMLIAVALSAAVCLLAGPATGDTTLGWEAAGVRVAMFAALVAALWQLTLKPDERREILGVAQRMAHR